jgi:cysteine desulfurase
MESSTCYLDYAAATPLDERVLAAMTPYLTEKFYNPSSPYLPAVEVRQEYTAAKQRIARCIGASADEIIMTAGATESINLALRSFGGHVICSGIEHDSVREAAGPKSATIQPDESGRISAQSVQRALRDDIQCVSVAVANHELGTIQPITEIAQCIAECRLQRQREGNTTPLYLHCDASQGVGLLDVHVGRLGVDLLTMNAAKIYGPKQVGLLWVRPGVQLQPVLRGGGQELGLRSGTENVAGTIGCALALEIAESRRKTEVIRLRGLRDDLQSRLLSDLPFTVVSGHKKYRLANFLHLSFPGLDAERLVFMLEQHGIYVATGSACAANKATGSMVLAALAVDESLMQGSLRMTLGRHTSRESIDRAVRHIVRAVRSECERVGMSWS